MYYLKALRHTREGGYPVLINLAAIGKWSDWIPAFAGMTVANQ